MREKELRLALVCYGGISLAVYMHGITKEVWRLARASRAYHDGLAPARRQPGRLPRADRGDRDGGRDAAARPARYRRGGKRGRDQRHLPRPRDRLRPQPGTADRSVAEHGRCRGADRARGRAQFALHQDVGDADRLAGGGQQRKGAGGDRARNARGSTRQARPFRPLALVRAAVRRARNSPACCSTRSPRWAPAIAGRACCPMASRSTCSSPSPISAAIPNGCGSIRRRRSSRPNTG